MARISEVTDETFAGAVADGLALVDFWAPWCGPCVALAPQLEKLAERYAGKVGMFKLDVQDNQETPIKFGVSAVPTMILFKDGKELTRIVGANIAQLISALKEATENE
ncbi:thioredoxin [Anaplasma platys]|uniref:Thioredoxin n=1 Tax=Anaplasma platys TaxID=949 RepID=A0A858PXB5_9RICK|nr:thioredoxin [Anaplasma platys]QJC27227.1 thioredoxin [Anaplasma platys]